MALIRRKDDDNNDKEKKGKKKKPLADKLYDEQYNELETRLKMLYSDAVKDMNGKTVKFLADYEKKKAQKLELLKQGKITQAEFEQWKAGQAFSLSVMEAQTNALTMDLVNTDKLAADMINGDLPRIYTTQYNFTGYQAELIANVNGIPYTNFTIYSGDAIKFLTKSPVLLPENVNLDIPKDFIWNKKHISTAISQGILQGESIPQIANRLMQVTDMDLNAALRNARTATGAARNQGAYDAVERINEQGKEYGIEVVKTWGAVVDARTRDSHLFLNGQHPNKKGLFGDGYLRVPLRFPKDPRGAPEDVYNCRCTLYTEPKVLGISVDHSNERQNYEKWLEQNYYEDWLKWKSSPKKIKEDEERAEAEVREQFIKALWAHRSH